MQYFKKIMQTTSSKWILVISILAGGIAVFRIRELVTAWIFSGKTFSGRSIFFQFGLTAIYFLILSLIFYLFFTWFWKVLKKTWFSLKNEINARIYAALILVGIGFSLIYFYNNIYPMIDTDDWIFSSFRSFYLMDVVGLDLRTGIYRPPQMILNGENIYVPMRSNYPPFTIFFFMPLQLFSENNAYLLMVFLYLISNIISLTLIAILVKDVFFSVLPVDRSLINSMGIFILFSLVFYTISSYPFLFTIERGNYDSIAFLFAVVGVYLIIKKPASIWLPVIFLSMATHLKMYPAVLFLILLINHGKKIILPTIITNVLMLLALGYNNALLFLDVIVKYSLAPVTWVGNHSGFSFADYLYETYAGQLSGFSGLRIYFTVLPILIWGISVYLIIRNLKFGARDLSIFMVSVPLMCTIPTVSHDYKLIILSASLLIMLSILIIKIGISSKWWDYLQLLFILLFSFLLGRSFLLFPSSFELISNKYPIIILLTIVMMINVIPLMKTLDKIADDKIPNRQHEMITQEPGR